ncbi:MAG: alkaline phosphatase family protein [Nannocystis sp.]|uniref:alkaline phosphatase family protein n=1 Tax=Nannocystis sp. TaxID=1962667 RepID=UPI00242587E9|nr:alkaline phosphatase family protein [Nannocystis sp.]MBK9752246.1 alkaline phosphatase family protein [Nannocystis sp.]
MPPRPRIWLLLACCAPGIGLPLALGLNYGARLSAPAGLYTVHVDDHIPDPISQHSLASPPLRRPRGATLVVVDGLGLAEARSMSALARLQAHGQCRDTDVGSLPLSRPVYAVLSTGLEADRNGVRGPDDSGPVAAPSIWELARAAGMSVSAISELPWWGELFTRGFDRYITADRASNYFTLAPPASPRQLRLIHPLYVDETGHEFGAASPQYHAAVDRVDRELDTFFDTLDLQRDLVIVTADHGHTLRGGHGGRQDRVAHVLTCFAGPGVRHLDTPGPLHATSVAPALALLLALPFPAEMRAGDDDLETLWDIVDPAAFPPDYLDDRRRSIDRFRAANQAQLRRWLPASDGSWDRFYAHHRARQLRNASPVLTALAVLLAVQARSHRRPRPALFGLAFVVLFYLALYSIQVVLRGSFDLSSIAHREDFIGFTLTFASLSTTAAVGLHLLVRRDLSALLLDLGVLSLAGTLLTLAHPAAFGWQLGFPLPPPNLLFFPYFAALVLPVANGLGLLIALACVVRAHPRRRSPPSPAPC